MEISARGGSTRCISRVLWGVSRTPVRAALQMLAGEGLLDHAPNRGFAVRSFSLDEIGDAFEVRALNEGLACRLAAERGLTLAQDDTIREVLGRGDRLLSGTVDLVELPARLCGDKYSVSRDAARGRWFEIDRRCSKALQSSSADHDA